MKGSSPRTAGAQGDPERKGIWGLEHQRWDTLLLRLRQLVSSLCLCPTWGEARADSLTHQQQLRGDVELSRNSLPGSSEQVGCVLEAPHIFLVPSCSETITEDSVKTPCSCRSSLRWPMWMPPGHHDRAVHLHRPIHVLPESFSGCYGLGCVP